MRTHPRIGRTMPSPVQSKGMGRVTRARWRRRIDQRMVGTPCTVRYSLRMVETGVDGDVRAGEGVMMRAYVWTEGRMLTGRDATR